MTAANVVHAVLVCAVIFLVGRAVVTLLEVLIGKALDWAIAWFAAPPKGGDE